VNTHEHAHSFTVFHRTFMLRILIADRFIIL